MRLLLVSVPAAALVSTAPARAASLERVSNWGASGVPSTVSMYIYVPDKLAANPPVLVCSHYCGGSAGDVFAEARGGGLVSAADQKGFIMVVPQAVGTDGKGRCWDVGTKKSLTHDGGGDTQAIAQMVKYTLDKYKANADRVYAIGISSGAMMTEALLAVYPDVFKAGAEFCGVPAGCWATGASADGTWSGPCAGGQVTHTAQEWGDLARAMDTAYSGRRPRIQLWHGDADSTINYKNHTEAIKQWTNVLGLSATPTSTSTLTYDSHQWTRESWQDSCGFTVLDAWTEHGGEHNVGGANLNAQYAIPFLGLDDTGTVDPEVAKCGGGGGDAGTDGAARDGGSAGRDDGGGAPNGKGGGDSGTKGGDGGAGAGEVNDDGGEEMAGDTSGGTGCALGGASSTRGAGALALGIGLVASIFGRRRRSRVG